MRRRGRLGGRAAIQRNQAREKKFDAVGITMGAAKIEHVEEQLQLFRSNLENFARKHKDNIRKDPQFRREFQIMCALVVLNSFSVNSRIKRYNVKPNEALSKKIL